MHTIEVEFDVLKALMAQRESEDVSYNDVIRKMLQDSGKLPESVKPKMTPPAVVALADDWIYKGVRFPVGTEFRADYKGERHYGRVDRGGMIVNGERATSPSQAAYIITKNAVNGWRFWECRFPGESGWIVLRDVRRKSRS